MAEIVSCETLVIGGGPAGAMAAALLAKRGVRVQLLERSTGPHEKVCGDFLSGEAAKPLRRIGLDPLALGGVPIGTLRIVTGRRVIETQLPFPAYGLSRAVLDDAVLRRAAVLGTSVRRGVCVRRLNTIGADGGWQAESEQGGLFHAQRVFLATGKTELRGHARDMQSQACWLGLKMPFCLAPRAKEAMGSAIELYLFEGFYAGLQTLPDGAANLCLAIPKARFKHAGARWELLLEAMFAHAPLLRERLSHAAPLLDRPLAAADIPYGYVTSPKAAARGLIRLGDQAAVVPSFTGDGVAMALRSAEIAAEIAADCASEEAIGAAIRASHGKVVNRAVFLSRVALSKTGQALLSRMLPVSPGLARAVAAATRVAHA